MGGVGHRGFYTGRRGRSQHVVGTTEGAIREVPLGRRIEDSPGGWSTPIPVLEERVVRVSDVRKTRVVREPGSKKSQGASVQGWDSRPFLFRVLGCPEAALEVVSRELRSKAEVAREVALRLSGDPEIRGKRVDGEHRKRLARAWLGRGQAAQVSPSQNSTETTMKSKVRMRECRLMREGCSGGGYTGEEKRRTRPHDMD